MGQTSAAVGITVYHKFEVPKIRNKVFQVKTEYGESACFEETVNQLLKEGKITKDDILYQWR